MEMCFFDHPKLGWLGFGKSMKKVNKVLIENCGGKISYQNAASTLKKKDAKISIQELLTISASLSKKKDFKIFFWPERY